MKRKFSKIVGVAVTLAMLSSLLGGALVALANVTTASVTLSNDDISGTSIYTVVFETGTQMASSYTLETSGGSVTAEWVVAAPIATDDCSAKLHAGFGASDWAEIVITPPAGITLDDMATITTGWSWDYYIASAAGNRGTSLELHFQSTAATYPNGYAEMTIMDDAYGAFPAGPVVIGAWTPQTIVSTTTTGLVFGKTEAGVTINEYPAGHEGTIADLVTYIIAQETVGDAGDWVLTEVRPALGWIGGGGQTVAYIDDVTIAGTTHDFEASTGTVTITLPIDPGDTYYYGVPATVTGATLQASPGWIGGEWTDATADSVTWASDISVLARTVTATPFCRHNCLQKEVALSKQPGREEHESSTGNTEKQSLSP